MNVDPNRMESLRALAQEPYREAMSRDTAFPSMSAELQRRSNEITALRRGLREALGIVDGFMNEQEERANQAHEARMKEL